MATIHSLISEAAVDFEVTTGKKPKNVYLGETEIKALKKWAYENQYTTKIDIEMRGGGRPEVAGLLVYGVNSTTHIACS